MCVRGACMYACCNALHIPLWNQKMIRPNTSINQKKLDQCAPVYHSKQHLTCYVPSSSVSARMCVRGAGIEELIRYVCKRCPVPVRLLWRTAHSFVKFNHGTAPQYVFGGLVRPGPCLPGHICYGNFPWLWLPEFWLIYHTCTIITRSWFETALVYQPGILNLKLKNFLV